MARTNVDTSVHQLSTEGAQHCQRIIVNCALQEHTVYIQIQGCCKNVEKITQTKVGLLDQSVMLYNYVPFQI